MNLTMVEVYSEELSEMLVKKWEVSLNCVVVQFPSRDSINIKVLIIGENNYQNIKLIMVKDYSGSQSKIRL